MKFVILPLKGTMVKGSHPVRRTISLLLPLFLCLSLLTGCQPASKQEQNSKDTSSVQGTERTETDHLKWSTDEPFAKNSGTKVELQTSADGAGVYNFASGTVRYYDCALDAAAVVCAQQGCQHTDAACVAWQGDVLTMGVWNNQYYAVIQQEGGGLALRQTNPADNTRKVLCQLPALEENSYYSVGELYFSHSYAYFSVQVITSQFEESIQWEYETISGVKLIQIDLENGDSQELNFEDGRSITFLGGTDDSFAMIYTYIDTESEPFLSVEEYYGQNPSVEEFYDGEAYMLYESGYALDHTVTELRVYSITSGSYEVLVSENMIVSDLGKCCYGDVIAYGLLDRDTGASEIWLYDLVTGQNVCLAQETWIMEYRFMDEKVFTHVWDPDTNVYTFYYIDIYSGEKSQIANQGETQYLKYSIWAETSDYFIAGDYAHQSLSKTDFYADNYSAARSFS